MPDTPIDPAPGSYGSHDSAALVVRLRALADDDRYCIDDWSQGICRQAADHIELLCEANSDVRRIALERDAIRRVLLSARGGLCAAAIKDGTLDMVNAALGE